MAATCKLDVSMALDDLGWHFGTWTDRRYCAIHDATVNPDSAPRSSRRRAGLGVPAATLRSGGLAHGAATLSEAIIA